MGYQALLFCPDEKTARTVTQVLSELEFNVESCTEPFAAVKRLMGEHFDAIVVDCDNEQNATLLFKSARSSTSNQASLAVAVVEGQAGVAKAFRIGANLVLTKPINVEQAKGTLRVARGLLRKGEPAKPGAPAAATAQPASSSGSNPPKATPIPAVRPAATVPSAVTAPRPTPPASKPAAIPDRPARAAAVTVSSIPAANAEDPIQIGRDEPASVSTLTAAPTPSIFAATPPAAPAFKSSTPAGTGFGSGAASAPAPARSTPTPKIEEAAPVIVAAPGMVVEQLTETVADESSSPSAAAPASSFTFGGANVPAESSGGSKKVLIGIATAAIVAGALYVGWTRFQGNPTQAVSSPKPTTPSPVVPSSSVPSNQTMSPAATTGTATVTETIPSSPGSRTNLHTAGPEATPAPPATADNGTVLSESAEPAALSAKPSNLAAPKGPALKSSPAPLVVHGGATPAVRTNTTAPDAQAPSMIGLATPSSGGALTNLVGSDSNTPAPVLQTMNVSQGVSQGLLIKKVQPTYPTNALHLHVEGSVQLLATITKSGNISAVKILSGDTLLTKAAAEAVKQWKYKPYLLNGEPVEIQTQIMINFKLPH